jgi:hypothetical protein
MNPCGDAKIAKMIQALGIYTEEVSPVDEGRLRIIEKKFSEEKPTGYQM